MEKNEINIAESTCRLPFFISIHTTHTGTFLGLISRFAEEKKVYSRKIMWASLHSWENNSTRKYEHI